MPGGLAGWRGWPGGGSGDAAAAERQGKAREGGAQHFGKTFTLAGPSEPEQAGNRCYCSLSSDRVPRRYRASPPRSILTFSFDSAWTGPGEMLLIFPRVQPVLRAERRGADQGFNYRASHAHRLGVVADKVIALSFGETHKAAQQLHPRGAVHNQARAIIS